MCDTLVALPAVTRNGNVLLAKNSDREPDEAQAILHVPATTHQENKLRCTYIDIPQVPVTYACILSKPFQMWGAEMGVNEHGVAIGNEAVFTKVKFNKNNQGLTGMDLLRLALERSTSADEAVKCITGLLEHYGQDANGGYRNRNFYYHNSFLIADPRQAFVLETAGREWAVERVKDLRSISNKLSMDRADELSAHAKSFALQKGWWKESTPFHFQRAYSDWFYTRMGRASARQACTTNFASSRTRNLTAGDCMQLLQTHNKDDAHFKPSRATTGSVCMHATGLLNPSSTTGSMVAEIRSGKHSTVWLTGTAHPCVSLYIPFYVGTDVLHSFITPSAHEDASLWWQAENVHRWIGKDYARRKALINEERKSLQREFLEKEAALTYANASMESLEAFSRDCLARVMEVYQRWGRLSGT